MGSRRRKGSLIADMCAKLKGVDTKGAFVPNSALFVKLFVMPDAASLEVSKRGKLVYINIFCFEQENSESSFGVVRDLYQSYGLGVPKAPSLPTWIHSIPVQHSLLRENEVLLSENICVSFYWAVFAQRLKKRNLL